MATRKLWLSNAKAKQLLGLAPRPLRETVRATAQSLLYASPNPNPNPNRGPSYPDPDPEPNPNPTLPSPGACDGPEHDRRRLRHPACRKTVGAVL